MSTLIPCENCGNPDTSFYEEFKADLCYPCSEEAGRFHAVYKTREEAVRMEVLYMCGRYAYEEYFVDAIADEALLYIDEDGGYYVVAPGAITEDGFNAIIEKHVKPRRPSRGGNLHLHGRHVDGCYRCDLRADEANA